MEAIRIVLVILVLVTGGVLALALVARLATRTKRRSTGPPTPHRPTTPPSGRHPPPRFEPFELALVVILAVIPPGPTATN